MSVMNLSYSQPTKFWVEFILVENEFYETNDFGNPTKYHVEFLGMIIFIIDIICYNSSYKLITIGSRHTQAWVESRSTVNYTGFPKDPIGKNGKVRFYHKNSPNHIR